MGPEQAAPRGMLWLCRKRVFFGVESFTVQGFTGLQGSAVWGLGLGGCLGILGV